MTRYDLLRKYQTALSSLPAPGNGCHAALLGVANLGVRADLNPEQIFISIRHYIPQGTRRVPDREINDAIKKAFDDSHNSHKNGSNLQYNKTKTEPMLRDGKSAQRGIIEQSKIGDEVDIVEASPVRIDWPPEEDAINFLSRMYEPADLIFMGEQRSIGILGQSIRTSAAWIDYFSKGGHQPPLIMINPLNGIACAKKSGDGMSLRGDSNIAVFKYCIAEYDVMSKDDQIKFWSAINMPIRALVDSGGKSIHGWIDLRALNINNLEQWTNVIKNRLYNQILVPMGVDSTCSNPSRLSRLPGHFRNDKDNYQRLLWLSPEGRRVIL